MCPQTPTRLISCQSRWPNREGRDIEFRAGESLFEALRNADQPVASSCSGSVVCGRCVVRVLEGSEVLSTMDEDERAVLQRESAAPDERLACRAYPAGSGVVLTTGYW